MLRVWPKSVADPHREMFLERYDRMLVWALTLTRNQRHAAEDLLQDAFVFLMNSRPDLSGVRNPDAYLYVVLRNLHRAQIQKGLRQRTVPLSILEFDSADAGIRSLPAPGHDDSLRIEMQNDLRRICHFACRRKATSRGGSILILRFFHGYYPHEIAFVLRCSRPVIDERLHLVRKEARAWLKECKEPNKIASISGGRGISEPDTRVLADRIVPDDVLFVGLREMIASARTGQCLARPHLREIYRKGSTIGPNHSELAHLASCEDCLNTVNRFLGLAELSERDPNDSLGNGNAGGNSASSGGPRRPNSSRGPGGASGSPTRRQILNWERIAAGILDHRPRQLCIAVNGEPLATEVVNSENSDLTVTVHGQDPVEFVEVWSEQDVRLAMLVVTDPPPVGSTVQTTEVALSGDRVLHVALSFDSPWPTVHVTYVDPVPQIDAALEWDDDWSGQSTSAPETRELPVAHFPWWLNPRFWLSAKTQSVATATILIVVLLLIPGRETAAGAAVLVARAEGWQRDRIRPGSALHRTFDFIEKPRGSTAVRRRRVEVWRWADSHRKISRLFDESGSLVKSARAEELPGALTFRNAWQFEPAADTFRMLTGDPGTARVERHNGEVELISGPVILKLDGKTFAPAGETIRTPEADFEFHEVATESVPESRVPADSPVKAKTMAAVSSSPAPPAAAPKVPAAMTAAELEETELTVRVTLHNLNADLGEEIGVRRWPNEIEVAGFVDSRERKNTIAAALQGAAHVRVSLLSPEDLAETVQRQTAAALSSRPEGSSSPQGSRAMHPPLLEAWLEAKYPNASDRSAFERRILALVRDCARRSLAVQKIAERYGRPADARMSAVVLDHLTALRRDLTGLGRQLGEALDDAGESPQPQPQGTSWTESAGQAFVDARQLESGVEELFTATTRESADVESTRRSVGSSQRRLEGALSRLLQMD